MGDSMHQPRDSNGQFVSLKEFITTIMDERDKAHTRLHAEEKEQIVNARHVIDERLNRMNEFRGALEDQASKMVSRELFDALAEKVNEVQRRLAFYSGAAALAGFILSTLLRLLGVTE